MHTETYFFDLGGVLIDFSHQRMCENIAKLCDVPPSFVETRLFQEGLSDAYERGDLDSADIHREMEALAQKPLHFKELIDACSNIFSPKPEMAALLEELKAKGARLILLSNTCKAHFDKVKAQFAFLELFDGCILSYEVGARKPEKKIFDAALEMGETPIQRCFYIDDVAEYVVAAKAMGLDGHHFKGVKELCKAIQERGTDCS